jgi:hypothetical protein
LHTRLAFPPGAREVATIKGPFNSF